MFMSLFVREKHGLHHVLGKKNPNKDINPFQKQSGCRASDDSSPTNFFLLWATLFEIQLLQKVFVPWCWFIIFYPQLRGFYALRLSWAGSASWETGQPHWNQKEERGALGKGCSLGWALNPWSSLSQRHVHSSAVELHKLVQKQMPVPSQLPELKPETGSTSRTRICSRFKQMQHGRCTMEFRSGRGERDQQHRAMVQSWQ